MELLSRRRLRCLLAVSLTVLLGVTALLASSTLRSRMAASPTGSVVATSVRRSLPQSEAASRSEDRRSLSTSSSGAAAKGWNLGESNTSIDVDRLSAPASSNAVVSRLLAQDVDILPEGFDSDHASGDVGNAYSYSQCTWWVYVRRHQLGLPVGSHLGNGRQWATSAAALGYWVDSTPRHKGDIMVFAAGQDGASAVYGHVAIVEKINADGSIVTSESGESYHGKTFSRTFTAAQASAFRYIHY
ncbi:CHAP domain-containing protein [uncultured Bifidobacterium sp.]|uniref:CHAP domain-containing protein n=1 Tax=uncultured Bifidobacterium sp. TaxID=165187 RepID=UPI0028DC3A97|nr:CHAP domain-containing protein [uncultured Bifidobacterium sp.]